jgi:hypothetical protein
MKKTILFVAALALGASSAFAQDLTSKKGEPFLPEAGDWSIGVEATPFLNYVGNFIGGNGANTAPTFNFLNGNNMITGKYFASETMAYRAMLRIGFTSTKWNNVVPDDASTATPQGTTNDELKVSSHFIGLGAGVEMRRGKTRLQGYYGAQLMFWMSGSKSTYDYGNAFSTTNTTPTTTDFTTPAAGGGFAAGPAGVRLTETKAGSMLGVGVRGFVGVEYFILPKISIGAEYGWGLGLMTTGEGSSTAEAWNGTGTTSTTSTIGKSSTTMIDTDNSIFGMGGSGQLMLNFHF